MEEQGENFYLTSIPIKKLLLKFSILCILSLMIDVILSVPGVCILGLYGNLYTMLLARPISDVGAFIVTLILVSIEYKKIAKLDESETSSTVETSKVENGHYVISIGRKFGSGRKYIGQELAKWLNIKCYDNNC